MTTIVFELFEALKKAGVDEDTARKATQAVLATEERHHLANKADLAELKADLIKWNVGTLLAMTGLFTAIVKLL